MSRPGESLAHAARRGVRWNAVNTIGSAALQLVQAVVLARFITPADFGRVAVILALVAVGTAFAEMGLSSALVQRAHPQRHEIATLYSINVTVGVFLFGLVWMAAPFIESFYRMTELADLVRATGAVLLISPAGQIYRALLQKKLEFRALAQINIAALTVATIMAVALAMHGAGVWALIAAYLMGEVLCAAGLVLAGLRRGYWAGFALDLPAVRGYLAFGALRLVAMIANAINSRVDQLVIGRVMGATPLGLYNVAQRIAMEPVQRVNPIVTQVAFPVLARVQADRERLRRGYLNMIASVSAVNAPLLVGLAATAPLVVEALLGPQWEASVPLVRLLACYALFRSIASASGALVLAAGRADWSLYWNVGLLFVLPTVVWIAARSGGSVTAVAAALVATQVVLLAAHYLLILRRIVGRCGQAYAVALLRPLACAALMGVVVMGLSTQLRALSPVTQLAALVPAGALLYIACSLRFQSAVSAELLATLRLTLRRPAPRKHDG